MFKWPGEPSACASEHELADFAELSAWQSGYMSMTALINFLGRLDENDYSDGVPEEEERDRLGENAYTEVDRREKACGDGYPFVVNPQGETLKVDKNIKGHRQIIYRYLLLATRLNMKDNRVHAGIDGALLFEDLAAEVARGYLGERAESLVFGTASEFHKFRDKVDTLCKRINEGGNFLNRNEDQLNAKDGKLDIVAWKRFTDDLAGKLILFGQCKTGTSYKDDLTHLQPRSFCDKWLQVPLVVTPVRTFFIAEALPQCHWQNISIDAGLLFDRCRIVDFCHNINADVLKKVTDWTQAAAKATELPDQ